MGRTTISVYEETKKRFRRANGKLQSRNGKSRTEDSVLNELLGLFEQFPEKSDLENIKSILKDVTTEHPNVLRYESALGIVNRLVEVAKCFG